MCGNHIPVYRAARLSAAMLGVPVSVGFVAGVRGKAADLLAPFMDRVRVLLRQADVLHADETTARAEGDLAYVHVACTEFLTHLHTGGRCAADIDAGKVLPGYAGTIVRDGYAGYHHLVDALHAWCGAHNLRETVIGHHKADLGPGMPVLRSKDPEGVAQEMWALFAVYQATAQLIGAGIDATGIPPDRISFPHALAAATATVGAFPPTVNTTWPWRSSSSSSSTRLYIRDRPDRTSPRKTKKAGDFPARKPDEPSVTNVTPRIQLHLLHPTRSG